MCSSLVVVSSFAEVDPDYRMSNSLVSSVLRIRHFLVAGLLDCSLFPSSHADWRRLEKPQCNAFTQIVILCI